MISRLSPCILGLMLLGAVHGSLAAAAMSCLDASDGQFTLGLQMVQITPELRLNGAPFVTSEENSVQIWLAQDGVLQVLLGETHLTPRPINVIADIYDLVYRNLTPSEPG